MERLPGRHALASLEAGAPAWPLVLFTAGGYVLDCGTAVEVDGPVTLRTAGTPVAHVCGQGVRAWLETTAAVRVRVG